MLNFLRFKRRNNWIFAETIVILCLELCTCSEINRETIGRPTKYEFDFLLFTQTWPITDCMTWMNRGQDHTCMLPSQKDTWIIHGVWPTKAGTMGPFFCNSSRPFDINALEPLMSQLKQYWANIWKGTPEDQLWKHEWEKHGTCAAVLEELSTENKYFGQGLAWLQQYAMNGLLPKSSIEPGSEYEAIDFHNAIKNVLKINPSIHCVSEKNQHGEQFLAEIRICFSKTLDLIDCNGALAELSEPDLKYYKDGLITDCDLSKKINYPKTVSEHLLSNEDREKVKTVWRFPWVNLYKLIQMIKWFTL